MNKYINGSSLIVLIDGVILPTGINITVDRNREVIDKAYHSKKNRVDIVSDIEKVEISYEMDRVILDKEDPAYQITKDLLRGRLKGATLSYIEAGLEAEEWEEFVVSSVSTSGTITAGEPVSTASINFAVHNAFEKSLENGDELPVTEEDLKAHNDRVIL